MTRTVLHLLNKWHLSGAFSKRKSATLKANDSMRLIGYGVWDVTEESGTSLLMGEEGGDHLLKLHHMNRLLTRQGTATFSRLHSNQYYNNTIARVRDVSWVV